MVNQSEEKIEYRRTIEETWLRYSEIIYKLCAMRCNSTEEARDLFQTIALKFCENADRILEREDVLPWLISVMRHTYMDSVLEKKRTLCMSGVPDRCSEYASFCEDQALYHEYRPVAEMRYALERSLEQVTPLERMLVEMKFYGGFSVRELSNIFGLSENAIRKRRYMALRKMHDMMGEWLSMPKMAQ
ncbi:RNA polymerase sigma factor [Fibrobacter sp. UWR2]|jgi:RNA polymerase sigma-70 factor (ECF subfamily)|uniref:RNA polymerase sigma factor n=1 Tax=Fibrobacter sp. UWR2 TaxID=1964352 RepID=UPI000B523959|nr:sigma-70 family RNA polymerase sigma factor [Fibrobacter sp. UWR2]OWV01688.1 hypothetical protein B7994_00140 [Fibrobacter sp. UWR2]